MQPRLEHCSEGHCTPLPQHPHHCTLLPQHHTDDHRRYTPSKAHSADWAVITEQQVGQERSSRCAMAYDHSFGQDLAHGCTLLGRGSSCR